MTQRSVVVPRMQTPSLDVALASGGTWSLAEQTPKNFTLILFYRGYHCPICKKLLQELLSMKEDFAEAGVNVVAISSNDQELGEKSFSEWELEGLDLGYGLSPEKALEWGLHLSTPREGGTDPDIFNEPGLFLVKSDGTLFCSSIQTMPFTRPNLTEILNASKFVVENNYPPRGQIVSM